MKDRAQWNRFFLRTARFVALALTVPLVAGALTAPRTRLQTAFPASARERPQFDAVSIKRSDAADPRGGLQFQRGRLVATNTPLRPLISLAYNLAFSQGRGAIIGAPSWFDSTRYDIEAKAEGDPPREQMIQMLQSLLADRFKMAVHRETRQLPVYALVLTKAGKTGPQLKPHSNDAECVDEPQTNPGPGDAKQAYCGDFSIGAGASGGLRETAVAIAMDRFAASLSQQVDRPVVDRTGLSGTFDLTLEFTRSQALSPGQGPDSGSPDSEGLPIFRALQEQLGLKLESATGPVDVLVIDHVEQPSEN